jgi:hypothetical protein
MAEQKASETVYLQGCLDNCQEFMTQWL